MHFCEVIVIIIHKDSRGYKVTIVMRLERLVAVT